MIFYNHSPKESGAPSDMHNDTSNVSGLRLVILYNNRLFTECIRYVLMQSLHSIHTETFLNLPDLEQHIGSTIMPNMILIDASFAKSMVSMLHAAGGKAKIIIISSPQNPSVTLDTIRHCSGILSDNSSVEELLECIAAVNNGQKYISKEIKDMIINNELSETVTLPRLSGRQQEILQLLCEGFTLREIATKLSFSIHTAQTHNRELLRKFGLRRNVELVAYAIEHKLYHS